MMQTYRWLPAPLLILLLVFAIPARAETLYVTDQLIVSLRSGPEARADVISYLKTDQPVEVLEDLGDYLKVRLATGKVGYVQGQYLSETVPKAETIAHLQAQNDRLVERVKQLEDRAAMSSSQLEQELRQRSAELQDAREKAAELENQLTRVQAEHQKLGQDFQRLSQDSGNVMAVIAERDRLLQDNRELHARTDNLEESRDALLKQGAIKWFFAGAAVLLLGWLIGKLSGSRRRSSLL